MGNRTLKDDVLSTTMCLVEPILNSRPMTSVSDDPEDLEALTPNHFLLGRASSTTPFIPDVQRYTYLRRVFNVSGSGADGIRYRKGTKNRQMEVKDLVWIINENVKRAHYKMEEEHTTRVLEVYHGSDGENCRWKTQKISSESGTPVLWKWNSVGKQDRQCSRQSFARRETQFSTWLVEVITQNT